MASRRAKFFSAFAALTLVMALSKRRLSYRVRVAALLSSVGVTAIYTLARGGYAPNAFIAFGFIIVAATLLLGVRGGVGATAVFALSLVVVPALQRAGVIQRADGWAALLDSADINNIGRVVTNFVVLSSSSVLAVSYLLRRGERLLQERTRSLERLASEQAEKERIRADLELREAAFRKASELEILGRLSGSMAHDFNNALLVIFAAIDQFSRAELTPELTEAVDAVRDAATQAASATRQLRAFGPQVADAPTHVVLGPALRRLVMLLARVLPSNIELALEVGEGLCVRADEGALQRMLTNLVLNARDAMRQGSAPSEPWRPAWRVRASRCGTTAPA
jgi:C4-dicarboxylate-specific signal transduction histidine kinase